MRPSSNFSVILLAIYLCIISACSKEATKAKEEDEIGCAFYEEQFASIQANIDAASEGDTVLIDPGTYVGSINFKGKNIVVGSLYLTTGDTSYIRQTIIDANNFGSVARFENGEGPDAVLAGLTLTNGNAVEGGGVYCNGASPTFSHLRIVENNAYSCGGGEDFKGAAGGGVFLKNSNATLTNVTVSQNFSDVEGGGIYMANSSLSMNLVTVYNDSATTRGGGIYSTNSSLEMVQVEVSHNSTERGGGLCLMNFSNVYIENANIAQNTAEAEGGGFFLSGAILDLVNVTAGGNEAGDHGGAAFSTGSTVELMNTMFGSSSPQEIYFPSSGSSNSYIISYSDIAGGLTDIETNNNGTIDWREGNTSEGCAPSGGMYCLEGPDINVAGFSPGSPCIDAGNPQPKYYDVEGRFCYEVAIAPNDIPDSNAVRNDMGGYGGPNGNWIRNPRN